MAVRVRVIDGPLDGQILDVHDTMFGRGMGITELVWSIDWREKVVYTPYLIAFKPGQPRRWVYALDKPSVQRYVEQLRLRERKTWRLHHRTRDGQYAFVNHYDGATHTVPIDEFWRKR